MYTLGDVTTRIIQREESWSINISAICDDVVPKGSPVVLKADGHVGAVAASTDKTFGIVNSGNTEAGDLVTIQTEFNALVNAQASGSVSIGDQLACNGPANRDKRSPYAVAGAGDRVSAIALSDGADGEMITIGYLRVGYSI